MIKLADTLAPMADFPAAMAEHVEFADGENLQQKLDDGSLGGGGGEKKGEFLTKEEYDQLEADGLLQEDKNYYILGEAGGEAETSTAFVITCEYEVDDENNWIISNMSETFATIDEALNNNREVILKTYPIGTTENPYILRPAMHYSNMGIMFASCVADGGQISGLTIMITVDDAIRATNDTYDFEGKQDKIEGTENQIVSFDAEGKVIAKDNKVIPIIENGKDVVYHKVTKNRDITELEAYTDRNGNTEYKIDDLYLTYDCEKLAKGIDDWLANKGITPVKGTTYEDIAQIQVYNPRGGGYARLSTHIKFDNTTYLSYNIKYNDTDYAITSVQYDYGNGKTLTTFTGLNVFNIAKIIPELAGCYIQSDILDVLHNWFAGQSLRYTFSLVDFYPPSNLKVPLNIQSSSNLSRESLLRIIDALAVLTTTQTLRIPPNCMAKLSEAEIAVATEKGWTIA